MGDMGEQASKSHMKGQKHKDRTPKNSITSHLFLNQHHQAKLTLVHLTSTQTTVKEVLIKDNVLHAEIRWILKIIEFTTFVRGNL